MRAAFEADRLEEAYDHAQTLLAQWPDNVLARKIRNAYEEQIRQARIIKLLQQADEAHGREEFESEALLLNQVLALDETNEAYRQRLRSIEHMVAQHQERAAIDSVVIPWNEGDRHKALTNFIDLSEKHRAMAMTQLDDPHFQWMDITRARMTNAKAVKAVDDILALGQLLSQLDSGTVNPDQLDPLVPHIKQLDFLSETKTGAWSVSGIL